MSALAADGRKPYFLAVKPVVINLEETPAKVVGKRRAPADPLKMTPAQTIADSRAWQKALHPLPIPRGVYRFKTHEEADEWLWQMLTRRRK